LSDTSEQAGGTESARDWFWVEVVLFVVVLIAGAGARYWLSTVLPFDETELRFLDGAAFPEVEMRVPMIMFAGLGLFFFYVFVRKSAGIPAAFAALLLLQTNLTFQEEVLRLHPRTLVAPVVMAALMAWRLRRPAWRSPPALSRVWIALALLFVARGTWLGAHLPGRLTEVRAQTHADPQALADSLRACGGGEITPLALLRDCELAWPPHRSLRQQELGLQHAARLGETAHRVTSAADWPESADEQAVLFDRAGACLLVVPAGAPAKVARETLRPYGHSR